jgi:hypothetical protein
MNNHEEPAVSFSEEENLDGRSFAHDGGFGYRRAVHERTAEPAAQLVEGAHDGR